MIRSAPGPNFPLSTLAPPRQHSLVPIVSYIIVAVGGYLLGSIPTGYLVAKARGIDIRTVGSKNMGATNVFRTLGKGPGIFVLFVDALKGFAASAWAADGLLRLFSQANPDPQASHLVAGIGAVLGPQLHLLVAIQGRQRHRDHRGCFSRPRARGRWHCHRALWWWPWPRHATSPLPPFSPPSPCRSRFGSRRKTWRCASSPSCWVCSRSTNTKPTFSG
jgi:hypothetical protein